jgi:hypothetical protein
MRCTVESASCVRHRISEGLTPGGHTDDHKASLRAHHAGNGVSAENAGVAPKRRCVTRKRRCVAPGKHLCTGRAVVLSRPRAVSPRPGNTCAPAAPSCCRARDSRASRDVSLCHGRDSLCHGRDSLRHAPGAASPRDEHKHLRPGRRGAGDKPRSGESARTPSLRNASRTRLLADSALPDGDAARRDAVIAPCGGRVVTWPRGCVVTWPRGCGWTGVRASFSLENETPQDRSRTHP